MNLSIPKDKEDRIYKAALDEFSDNGYKNASTNNIVKESGISKGALFNYFVNKRNLYLYVVKRALETLEKDLISSANELSTDMFERINQFQKIKIESSIKNPKESKVIIYCFTTEEEEFKEDLKEEYEYYEKLALELSMKNIDYSKFKEGVDPKKVYGALFLMSSGYKDMLAKRYKDNISLMLNDFDEISEELNGYMNLIKDSVYK